jgi:hypothetical protein
MVAVIVEVDSKGWCLRDLMVRLAPHMVARLMQRTTKNSSLQRFAEVLRYHILAVLPMVHHVPEEHSLTSVSGSGAVVWVPYHGGMRGVTWLGIESIRDPELAKLCQKAGDTKLGLHLEPLWKTERLVALADGTTPMQQLLSA